MDWCLRPARAHEAVGLPCCIGRRWLPGAGMSFRVDLAAPFPRLGNACKRGSSRSTREGSCRRSGVQISVPMQGRQKSVRAALEAQHGRRLHHDGGQRPRPFPSLGNAQTARLSCLGLGTRSCRAGRARWLRDLEQPRRVACFPPWETGRRSIDNRFGTPLSVTRAGAAKPRAIQPKPSTGGKLLPGGNVKEDRRSHLWPCPGFCGGPGGGRCGVLLRSPCFRSVPGNVNGIAMAVRMPITPPHQQTNRKASDSGDRDAWPTRSHGTRRMAFSQAGKRSASVELTAQDMNAHVGETTSRRVRGRKGNKRRVSRSGCSRRAVSGKVAPVSQAGKTPPISNWRSVQA